MVVSPFFSAVISIIHVVLNANQPPYVVQLIDFQLFYPSLYLNSYEIKRIWGEDVSLGGGWGIILWRLAVGRWELI